MKKLIAVLLVIVTLLSAMTLASCGASSAKIKKYEDKATTKEFFEKLNKALGMAVEDDEPAEGTGATGATDATGATEAVTGGSDAAKDDDDDKYLKQFEEDMEITYSYAQTDEEKVKHKDGNKTVKESSTSARDILIKYDENRELVYVKTTASGDSKDNYGSSKGTQESEEYYQQSGKNLLTFNVNEGTYVEEEKGDEAVFEELMSQLGELMSKFIISGDIDVDNLGSIGDMYNNSLISLITNKDTEFYVDKDDTMFTIVLEVEADDDKYEDSDVEGLRKTEIQVIFGKDKWTFVKKITDSEKIKGDVNVTAKSSTVETLTIKFKSTTVSEPNKDKFVLENDMDIK